MLHSLFCNYRRMVAADWQGWLLGCVGCVSVSGVVNTPDVALGVQSPTEEGRQSHSNVAGWKEGWLCPFVSCCFGRITPRSWLKPRLKGLGARVALAGAMALRRWAAPVALVARPPWLLALSGDGQCSGSPSGVWRNRCLAFIPPVGGTERPGTRHGSARRPRLSLSLRQCRSRAPSRVDGVWFFLPKWRSVLLRQHDFPVLYFVHWLLIYGT